MVGQAGLLEHEDFESVMVSPTIECGRKASWVGLNSINFLISLVEGLISLSVSLGAKLPKGTLKKRPSAKRHNWAMSVFKSVRLCKLYV